MASSIGLTSMSLRAVSLTASLYPRFILLSPSPQCYRAFSQSQASKAKGIPQSLSVKRPAEPSMQSRYRDQFRDRRGMEIPQDIGILPGTFVRPEGEDLPSIFQQPRERLRMEWVWLKSWAQNVVGYAIPWFGKVMGSAQMLMDSAELLHTANISTKAYRFG
jgi:protein MBA1